MTVASRGSSSAPPATARASRINLPGFRILAIDYGRKRIGLALSDELQLTARPLGALLHKNRRQVLRCVSQIAHENSVGKILIGHPVHLNGRSSEIAVEAERFAVRVQKQLGLPVELVDERLTSWEAGQQVAELQSARGRVRTRHNLDSVAAAILLREYLERTPDPKKGQK